MATHQFLYPVSAIINARLIITPQKKDASDNNNVIEKHYANLYDAETKIATNVDPKTYRIINLNSNLNRLPKNSIFDDIAFIPNDSPDFRFVPIASRKEKDGNRRAIQSHKQTDENTFRIFEKVLSKEPLLVSNMDTLSSLTTSDVGLLKPLHHSSSSSSSSSKNENANQLDDETLDVSAFVILRNKDPMNIIFSETSAIAPTTRSIFQDVEERDTIPAFDVTRMTWFQNTIKYLTNIPMYIVEAIINRTKTNITQQTLYVGLLYSFSTSIDLIVLQKFNETDYQSVVSSVIVDVRKYIYEKRRDIAAV
jgi:hypothetical protein